MAREDGVLTIFDEDGDLALRWQSLQVHSPHQEGRLMRSKHFSLWISEALDGETVFQLLTIGFSTVGAGGAMYTLLLRGMTAFEITQPTGVHGYGFHSLPNTFDMIQSGKSLSFAIYGDDEKLMYKWQASLDEEGKCYL